MKAQLSINIFKEDHFMLFKNKVRFIEYDQWMCDVVAEVVDCLPNSNYRIRIKTQELPFYEKAKFADGYCFDINEEEYDIVVPYTEAECIMDMPEKFYEFNIVGRVNCICRSHVYEDHREIDIIEIPSFSYLYKFLKIVAYPAEQRDGVATAIEGNINHYVLEDHDVFEEFAQYDNADGLQYLCESTNICNGNTYTSNVKLYFDKHEFFGLGLPITRYDFHYNGEIIDIIEHCGLDKDFGVYEKREDDE